MSSPLEDRLHHMEQSLNTSVPHSARMWNYWLGGKDNYEADRQLGQRMAELYPQIIEIARASRKFQARAVRYLAAEAGIRQFLDLGTGLPTANATHEVAQEAAPTSRIVYVDHDPIVLAHARALLTSGPEGATDYVHGDLTDASAVLGEAARTLDLTQPVAVLIMSTLGHVADSGEAHRLLRSYLDALPSGSYLVQCDTIETPESKAASDDYADGGAMPYISRPKEEMARFTEDLDVLDPGFGSISLWRPEEPPAGEPLEQWGFVGRKP